MNERIQELAEQARQYANSMYPSGLDIPKWGPAYHEKFAELIVSECTQVLFAEAERLNGLSSEETNLRTSDHLESCAEQCMDNIVRIEEHFGVAE
jgi:hypothetical protein